MVGTLDAALGDAARGWPVLPIKARGKIPLTAHRLHDGTTGQTIIRAW